MIRVADTGKCPLSEKIYELSVETNEIFRYIRVSVEKGSTVHFHPADSRSHANKTINGRRRSSMKTTV